MVVFISPVSTVSHVMRFSQAPVRFQKHLNESIQTITGHQIVPGHENHQQNWPWVKQYIRNVTPKEFLALDMASEADQVYIRLLLHEFSTEKLLDIWQYLLKQPDLIADSFLKPKPFNNFYHYDSTQNTLIYKPNGCLSWLETTYGLTHQQDLSKGMALDSHIFERKLKPPKPYTNSDLYDLLEKYFLSKNDKAWVLDAYTYPDKYTQKKPKGIAVFENRPGTIYPVSLWMSYLGIPLMMEISDPKSGQRIHDEWAGIEANHYFPVALNGTTYYLPDVLHNNWGTRNRTQTDYIVDKQVKLAHNYSDLFCVPGLYQAYVKNLNYQAQNYLSRALNKAIALLPSGTSPRITELGAANGEVLETFRRRYKQYRSVPVTAIDICKPAMDRHFEKNKRYHYNQYWLGSIAANKHMRQQLKEFDPNILLIGSVNHAEALPDIVAAFNTLKKGSLFIINTPTDQVLSLQADAINNTLEDMLNQGVIEQLKLWPKVFHRLDVNGKKLYFKVLIAQKHKNYTLPESIAATLPSTHS